MTKALKQGRSKWWRFNQYEIKDERIRPAPGAKLEEYDPWADYEKSRAQNAQPPYRRLLELRDLIKIQRGDVKALLSTAHQRIVLDWTARYGLLGILPQQTIIMHCAPRETPLGDFQPVFHRVGGRFINQEIYSDKAAMYDQETIHFPFDSIDEPSIMRRSIASVAGRFFLDATPHPVLSPEFWDNYAEPIWDWFMAVHTASLAIRKRDDHYLNLILSSVGNSVRFRGANAELIVNYPSLLSALAAMFVQDSIAGFRIIKCAGCGADVVTSAYQTAYCSRTCGDRDRKRRSRAAAKLAAVVTRSRVPRRQAP